MRKNARSFDSRSPFDKLRAGPRKLGSRFLRMTKDSVAGAVGRG